MAAFFVLDCTPPDGCFRPRADTWIQILAPAAAPAGQGESRRITSRFAAGKRLPIGSCNLP
jgi:hypothetical protein